MNLTGSDVASLSKALSCWEYAEYAFAALVAVACAGEYVADFTDWFTGGVKEAKDRLAKRSTLLLIAALAFELACLVKTNSLSARLVGSLSDKAARADTHAQAALDKSAIAETKSSDALIKAGEADTKADEAELATKGTQTKLGLVSEKADEIDADLARTQYAISGRSVSDSDALIKGLRQYRGVVVHFGSYNSEPDESLLCGELKSAAVSAQMSVPQDTCGRVVQVGTLSTGVVISGPDVSQTLALAQLILRTSNLGPGGVVSGIKAPELKIFVAAKPPFTVGQTRGMKAQKSNQVNKVKPKP